MDRFVPKSADAAWFRLHLRQKRCLRKESLDKREPALLLVGFGAEFFRSKLPLLHGVFCLCAKNERWEYLLKHDMMRDQNRSNEQKHWNSGCDQRVRKTDCARNRVLQFCFFELAHSVVQARAHSD